MTASFIGVITHFFADHNRHNATIAVRHMPSPHTAENILSIVRNILVEWNIPTEKVGNIITDNGSNMIEAFKEDLENPNESEDEDKTESREQEIESFDDDTEMDKNDGDRNDDTIAILIKRQQNLMKMKLTTRYLLLCTTELVALLTCYS